MQQMSWEGLWTRVCEKYPTRTNQCQQLVKLICGRAGEQRACTEGASRSRVACFARREEKKKGETEKQAHELASNHARQCYHHKSKSPSSHPVKVMLKKKRGNPRKNAIASIGEPCSSQPTHNIARHALLFQKESNPTLSPPFRSFDCRLGDKARRDENWLRAACRLGIRS